MSVYISPNGQNAKVKVSDWNLNDVTVEGSSGKISQAKIFNKCIDVHLVLSKERIFFSRHELRESYRVFVRSSILEQICFSHELEGLAQQDHSIVMLWRVANVGVTSFSISSDLWVENDVTPQTQPRDHTLNDFSSQTLSRGQSVLAFTFVLSIVLVDKVSNNARELPRWWLERYKSVPRRQVQHRITIRVQEIEPIQREYEQDYVVQARDIDSNNHMNTRVYVKVCFDAAAAGAVAARWRGATPTDILTRCCKMECAFHNESHEGDTLSVKAQYTHYGTILMSIVNRSKRDACAFQMKMTFNFSPQNSSL